jgi:high-affinity Fe2+/Pb2+ permease
MLEIFLASAGVWTLFKGKVPGWIVAKPGYEVIGKKARIIGFILSLPYPVSLILGVLLNALFGQEAAGYTFFLELALFIIDLIIVIVLLRKFRTPIPEDGRQP